MQFSWHSRHLTDPYDASRTSNVDLIVRILPGPTIVRRLHLAALCTLGVFGEYMRTLTCAPMLSSSIGW